MARQPADLPARTHRALANVNRVRLLKLLQSGPRSVQELAAATGLHPNTVRAHLSVLADGGLVARRQPPPSGPGRPAALFALAAPPPPERRAELQKLTGVLATALRSVAADPVEAATAAGEPWGRSLVAGREPASTREALEQVVAVLDDIGFEPELLDRGEQAEVLLHRCPFDELARDYGDIVCAVHLGVVRGALEELGASVRADLTPFVQPTLCVVRLTSPPEQ